MKSDDAGNSHRENSDKLTPSSADVDTNDQTENAEKLKINPPKRKKQKWSLWRHWKRASRAKQVRWILEGIATIVGISILGVYIWGNLQNKWHFEIEHAPLVINNRPPELIQPFICDISNGLHTGNMQTFIKNTGNITAYNVDPYEFRMKVIPETKTGTAFWDAMPEINCDGKGHAKDMEFPLPPGREVRPQIGQTAMNLPPLHKDTAVNLYFVSCIHYLDQNGGNHGTCDTYQLYLPSDNPSGSVWGNPTFFCDGLPKVGGRFMGSITGHCQK
jgi:hypothetical protein